MSNALFSRPVRNPSSWEEVMKQVFNTESSKIRTTIPAKVVEVDYERSLVLVQPLIRTWWEKWRAEVPMWPLEGVPIIFSSAGRGTARITLPIRKGDIGLVLFADRHTETYLGSTGDTIVNSGSMGTLGIDGFMNVVGFLPEIFTESNNKGFSREELVVENGKGIITIRENGKIVCKNKKVSTTMTPEGDCTTTNGEITSELKADGSGSISNSAGGSIELLADGTISLNGVTISLDGVITAPTVAAVSSLTKGGVEVNAP